MLHGAGKPQSEVKFWRHDLTSLADLELVRRDAGVDKRPGATAGSAQPIGELADMRFKIVRACERATAGDDDACFGEFRPRRGSRLATLVDDSTLELGVIDNNMLDV